MKKYWKAFIPLYGILYVMCVMTNQEFDDFEQYFGIYYSSAFAQAIYILVFIISFML